MSIEKVNEFNNKKFSQLVSRILNNLPNEGAPIFNETELGRLETVFETPSGELADIVVDIKTRFEKAAFLLQNPTEFENSLSNDGFHGDKSRIMSQLWTEHAKTLVDRYKGRCVGARELLDVNWRLGLVLGHSNKTHVKEPLAAVELAVRNNEDRGTIENHNIEFNHEELLQFYRVLEDIQDQLDAMSK